MKTLIIFYSYTGHAKALAQALAAKESANIMEIKDTQRPGALKAYTSGCYASIRGKSWAIEPLSENLAAYERLILFSPVWANNPPPAVNAFLEKLPKNKTVAIKMVSASGRSGCKDRVTDALKTKGCSLESFEDLKS